MKLRIFALAAVVFAALGPVSSQGAVAVGISVGIAPPPLVAYAPPPVPGPGFIWTPGYWAWSPVFGYYWVPGAWVRAPGIGLYWTPPWWGFDNGLYVFHDGYWGPTVGWYGGINYGYGYFGSGYWGGRWDGNVFAYNTAVYQVNKTVITNTYVDRTVLSKAATTTKRASFNGPGGVQAQPTAEQRAAAENAKKSGPTSEQLVRREAAAKDPKLQAKVNKGHPPRDAVQAFNKKHEQAQTGGAAGAGGRETAGAAKTESATGAGAEQATGARSTKKSAAGTETSTRNGRERTRPQTTERGERGRGAERPERGRTLEQRHPASGPTKTKPRESSSAVNRRPTYTRSGRPELGPGRQVAPRRVEAGPGKPTAGERAGGAEPQQKGKKKKDQNGRP